MSETQQKIFAALIIPVMFSFLFGLIALATSCESRKKEVNIIDVVKRLEKFCEPIPVPNFECPELGTCPDSPRCFADFLRKCEEFCQETSSSPPIRIESCHLNPGQNSKDHWFKDLCWCKKGGFEVWPSTRQVECEKM